MKYDLKPCPFCGGTKLIIDTCANLEMCENFVMCEEDGFVAVICDFRQGGCGASGGYRGTAEKAVEVWNRREK